MNFCSHCGSSNLRFCIPKHDTHPRFVCQDCSSIFYQNPRMIVGCLPLYNDKILLCKRSIEPRFGYWNLPAGFLENDETVEQGALRELQEEAGVKGEIIRLHTLYNIPQFNHVYLIFLTEIETDTFPESTTESLEIKLFDKTQIPWDEIAFSSSTFSITKFLNDPYQKVTHLGGVLQSKNP